jgi:hypothetical protein
LAALVPAAPDAVDDAGLLLQADTATSAALTTMSRECWGFTDVLVLRGAGPRQRSVST